MIDINGYHSNGWILIDLMSTKITKKARQTETQINPFTDRLEKALCFKIKTAGEYKSDVLSLLPIHMFSNCCQLSG